MSATAKYVLNVADRKANGSGEARRVRAAGMIPAVIYGAGGAPRNVSVQASEWEALQKFEFNMVSLAGNGASTIVLVKDVQHNFITGKASHIDFLAVDMNKPLVAVIPLHQGHTAPAGLSAGGLLEQYVHEIEVECLPANLPEHIIVDVAALGMGDTLYVKDIQLPEGVTAKSHGDIAVFRVINPMALQDDIPAAAAPAEAAGDAKAEPEVVGEKEKAERAAAREEAKKK